MEKCKDSSFELFVMNPLPNLFKCFLKYLMKVIQLATTGKNKITLQAKILTKENNYYC